MENNTNMAAVIEYDENLEEITVTINCCSCNHYSYGFGINAREVATVEKVLSAMNIPCTEKLGNLLEESEIMMKEYRKDDLYQLGVQAGIQQMMDKIESQYERGKPVLANGKLYWMKNDIENLQDIMDDLENMSNEDNINGRK